MHLASGGTAVGVGKYAEHDRAVEVNPEWEVYVKGKALWELIYPVGRLTAGGPCTIRSACRDRKSTCLNSSH